MNLLAILQLEGVSHCNSSSRRGAVCCRLGITVLVPCKQFRLGIIFVQIKCERKFLCLGLFAITARYLNCF